MKQNTVTLDSSVWIPYLRERRHARSVDALVADGRVWVPSVVLLELYAGTASPQDKRAVDQVRAAARALGRLFHPSEDDLCLAGQLLADHARRHGALRPRDHSHDLLIALSAARTASVLVTENLRDMGRWAAALRRRARLALRVARPEG